ncbi:MAG: hypothetical protein HQ567_09020 [Candidatus Nealsonbacteria bacterium]|nr:hypothetical protein [Candidatus Nealsonbacteria bacterium]
MNEIESNDLESIEQSEFCRVLHAVLKLGLEGNRFKNEDVVRESSLPARGAVGSYIEVLCQRSGTNEWVIRAETVMTHLQFITVKKSTENSERASEYAEKALKHSEKALAHSETTLKHSEATLAHSVETSKDSRETAVRSEETLTWVKWSIRIAVASLVLSLAMSIFTLFRPFTLNEDQFNEVKTRMERIEKVAKDLDD